MSRQIASLTGIRGIAALAVLACHLPNVHGLEFVGSGVLGFVSRKGWLGVDLFFVLSGFVISYVHQHEFVAIRRTTCWRFWGLRIARVYPAHLVTTVALIPLFLVGSALARGSFNPAGFTVGKLIYSLTLLNGWGFPDSEGWNLASWSVSSEGFAYLIFPLLACALCRVRGIRWNLAAVLIVFGTLFGLAFALNGGRGFMLGWEFCLVRVSSEFLIGCLLYNLFCGTVPGRWFDHGAAASLLVVGVVPLLTTWSLMDGVVIMALAALVFCLSLSCGYMERGFSNSAMMYLGRVSYSLYLIHGTFIMLMNQASRRAFPSPGTVASLAVLCCTIGGSLIAAHFLFRYVEEPGRTLIRRYLLADGAEVERLQTQPVASAGVGAGRG